MKPGILPSCHETAMLQLTAINQDIIIHQTSKSKVISSAVTMTTALHQGEIGHGMRMIRSVPAEFLSKISV